MNTLKIKSFIFAYNVILAIGLILYLIFLLITFKKKKLCSLIKNNLIFDSERNLNNKKYVWIHAASIGEIKLIFPIIEEIIQKYKEYSLLVTSCTKSSKNILLYKFGNKVTHYYLPLDFKWFVNKFIKKFSIKLAIFVEADFWPNFLFTLKHNKIPILLFNGRMSDRSFSRWLRASFLITALLKKFNFITADSIKSYKNLEYFIGKDKVKYFGNLKYAERALCKNINPSFTQYSKIFNDKNVIIALSTHYPEEVMFGDIYTYLIKLFPDFILIIIPRHIERICKIKLQMEKKGLVVNIVSSIDDISNKKGIFIVNTFGQSAQFLQLAKIVYIGKSMFKESQGGHNLLEPLQYRIPVIFGMYMDNFKEVANLAIEEGAALEVHNPNELKEKLKELFSFPDKLKKMTEKSKLVTKLVTEKDKEIKENYLKLLKYYLSKVS